MVSVPSLPWHSKMTHASIRLRDSTNQVAPYLPLLPESPSLQILVRGLIQRQASCLLSDPWANAFKEHPGSPDSQWAFGDQVKPPVSDLVFESKFELDSLAAFLKVSILFSLFKNYTN